VAFLADRQPTVYRRYDHWWRTLPGAEWQINSVHAEYDAVTITGGARCPAPRLGYSPATEGKPYFPMQKSPKMRSSRSSPTS